MALMLLDCAAPERPRANEDWALQIKSVTSFVGMKVVVEDFGRGEQLGAIER